MALVRFRWNGGLQLGPKEAASIVGFLILLGGGIAHYRAMSDKLDRLEIKLSIEEQIIGVQNARLDALEKRVDPCCPLFSHRLRPANKGDWP